MLNDRIIIIVIIIIIVTPKSLFKEAPHYVDFFIC